LRNGITIEEDLLKLYEKMQRMLFTRGARVDGIFYFPHGPEANCICRKSRPGLLYQIGKEFDIDLSNTVMEGDSISDVRAAKVVNAKPVLVGTGKGECTLQHFAETLDVSVYDDLAHFVRETLRRRH
jgi:D-glycero-D-manno-heptose 1,7-bisphosphate phosphatase